MILEKGFRIGNFRHGVDITKYFPSDSVKHYEFHVFIENKSRSLAEMEFHKDLIDHC